MVSMNWVHLEVSGKDEHQACKGTPKGATQMILLSRGNLCCLSFLKCGPEKQEDTKAIVQTHIDIQDLISGTFGQKGLSGSA